jgi:hypothetical protein
MRRRLNLNDDVGRRFENRKSGNHGSSSGPVIGRRSSH